MATEHKSIESSIKFDCVFLCAFTVESSMQLGATMLFIDYRAHEVNLRKTHVKNQPCKPMQKSNPVASAIEMRDTNSLR